MENSKEAGTVATTAVPTYADMLRFSSWADFPWPEWVPEKQRACIEAFWSEQWRRSPRSYSEASTAECYKAPEMGTRVTVYDRKTSEPASDHPEGRYLHCWNNIGRVIHDDGAISYVSIGAGKVWRLSHSRVARDSATNNEDHSKASPSAKEQLSPGEGQVGEKK